MVNDENAPCCPVLLLRVNSDRDLFGEYFTFQFLVNGLVKRNEGVDTSGNKDVGERLTRPRP